MELRELKREVEGLPDLRKLSREMHERWIKPLQESTARSLAQKLDPNTRGRLQQQLFLLHNAVTEVQSHQIIHERLHNHSRYLIEMKLASLQNDFKKSKMMAGQLLNDDYSGMKQTLQHVKSFQEKVSGLQQQHEEISQLVHKHLSLEETVYLMSLPHQKYLSNLLKIASHQQKIVRDLGRHFSTITEELQVRKRAQR